MLCPSSVVLKMKVGIRCKQCGRGARIEAPMGLLCWRSVPSPMEEGPPPQNSFLLLTLKMVDIGAFWVVFLQFTAYTTIHAVVLAGNDQESHVRDNSKE